MARPTLTSKQIEDARAKIRSAAFDLFAEHGYRGVTVRALAERLGWSHAKPYRYYTSKQEIFEALEDELFDKFGHRLRLAASLASSPLQRIHAMGIAYVSFAIEEPNAHKLLFRVPLDGRSDRGARKTWTDAWSPILDAVTEATDRGDLEGDPVTVAHVFWVAVNGLVSLHLAGRLVLGRSLEQILEPMLDQLIRGALPSRTGRRSQTL